VGIISRNYIAASSNNYTGYTGYTGTTPTAYSTDGSGNTTNGNGNTNNGQDSVSATETANANATANAQANANGTAQANANATADANANANATAYAQETAAAACGYSDSNSPSGYTFNGTTQTILTSAQLASQVYGDYQAETLTSSFTYGQTIYLSYRMVANQGSVYYKGYIRTIWHWDCQSQTTSSYTSYIDGSQYTANVGAYGDFTEIFPSGSGQVKGAVELLWCNDTSGNTCSLAWVNTFTVSN
jgi:hypothetical protein